jgi:hypothetical protein
MQPSYTPALGSSNLAAACVDRTSCSFKMTLLLVISASHWGKTLAGLVLRAFSAAALLSIE